MPANRTRSFRDALFAGFLCLSLLGPLALWVAEGAIEIPLPSWLASEDAVYLAGGQTRGDIPGAASWEGFASGELQDAVESEVGSFIPAKATALFTTAGMQRGAIEASNALFGWNCYPTFYDSDIVAVPSEARLAEMAQVRTEPWTQEVSRTAEDVAAFAERHPELRVLAYVGPDSQNVAGSPTGELMSDPVTYDGLQALFKEHAGPFEWVSGAVTYDEFLRNWYKTDHHWNIGGAFDGYCRLARALGFGDEMLEPTEELVFARPLFYGTFDRRGLDTTYHDVIVDYGFEDFPSMTVTIDREQASVASLAHSEWYSEGVWGSNQYGSRYAEYFHTDYGLIEIVNEDSESEEELVIVGDSYSNAMERFLAAHYVTTYVLDPRHLDETADEFLAAHQNVSDVVFVMRSSNLTSSATERFLGEGEGVSADARGGGAY